MCRLDSSVNYIIHGILAIPVCGIHPGYVNTGVVYYILIVDRTNYTIHIVYNLRHVILDDNDLLLYGPQIVMPCAPGKIICCARGNCRIASWTLFTTAILHWHNRLQHICGNIRALVEFTNAADEVGWIKPLSQWLFRVSLIPTSERNVAA